MPHLGGRLLLQPITLEQLHNPLLPTSSPPPTHSSHSQVCPLHHPWLRILLSSPRSGSTFTFGYGPPARLCPQGSWGTFKMQICSLHNTACPSLALNTPVLFVCLYSNKHNPCALNSALCTQPCPSPRTQTCSSQHLSALCH